MPSPYNLYVHHKCEDCTVRANRDFCNMSQASVAVLGRVKFTSVYPAGSVVCPGLMKPENALKPKSQSQRHYKTRDRGFQRAGRQRGRRRSRQGPG